MKTDLKSKIKNEVTATPEKNYAVFCFRVSLKTDFIPVSIRIQNYFPYQKLD
jgi:hypothetical protein